MTFSYRILGSNIRQARKAMHLTQAQTAEKLCISLLHYGRLERGDRSISLIQLAHIADILHISFHDLLCGAVLDDHAIRRQIRDTFTDISKADTALIAELYQVIHKHRI